MGICAYHRGSIQCEVWAVRSLFCTDARWIASVGVRFGCQVHLCCKSTKSEALDIPVPKLGGVFAVDSQTVGG